MSRSPNRLLASLSAGDYRRLAPRLHTIRLNHGSTLPHCGVARVYFPGTGVSSILSRMTDGTTIEVASVGNEGVVGLPALGSQFSAGSYLHVSRGTLQYMALNVFETFCVETELGPAVGRFCGMFTQSVMQLVACNRLHPLEARCARWILLTHERLRRANFELTQAFLAIAIGAKSGELASIMDRFAERHIVKHDAGSVTLLDPIALRRQACSCYPVLRKNALAPIKLRHRSGARRPRANVIAMQPMTACTLCGLTRDYPHKTHTECLRALDADLRAVMQRAKQLTQLRGQIAFESMKKFAQFATRSRS